nr:hypothetical protein Iba_chr02dCG7920 [Ipomoea batatas]GMC66950.1 hypothetical protein Iba_chr02eCG10430 [Ipomoea batatas]GMC68401.1 hypothetical protein Iba_chr02fCG11520 [Ipomoea batatas]
MCCLQANTWFLHTMLQVFYLLSCYLCIKGRLPHGVALLGEKWETSNKNGFILRIPQGSKS